MNRKQVVQLLRDATHMRHIRPYSKIGYSTGEIHLKTQAQFAGYMVDILTCRSDSKKYKEAMTALEAIASFGKQWNLDSEGNERPRVLRLPLFD